jgi:hypothetical protein
MKLIILLDLEIDRYYKKTIEEKRRKKNKRQGGEGIN